MRATRARASMTLPRHYAAATATATAIIIIGRHAMRRASTMPARGRFTEHESITISSELTVRISALHSGPDALLHRAAQEYNGSGTFSPG